MQATITAPYKITIVSVKTDGSPEAPVTEEGKDERYGVLVFSRRLNESKTDTSEDGKISAYLDYVGHTAKHLDIIHTNILNRHNYASYAKAEVSPEIIKREAHERAERNDAVWMGRNQSKFKKLGESKKEEIRWDSFLLKNRDKNITETFESIDWETVLKTGDIEKLSEVPYVTYFLLEVLRQYKGEQRGDTKTKEEDFKSKLNKAASFGVTYLTDEGPKQLEQNLENPMTGLQCSMEFILEECAVVLCLRMSGKYNCLYYYGQKFNCPTEYLSTHLLGEEFNELLVKKISDVLKKNIKADALEDRSLKESQVIDEAKRLAKAIIQKINKNPMRPMVVRNFNPPNSHQKNGSYANGLNGGVGVRGTLYGLPAPSEGSDPESTFGNGNGASKPPSPKSNGVGRMPPAAYRPGNHGHQGTENGKFAASRKPPSPPAGSSPPKDVAEIEKARALAEGVSAGATRILMSVDESQLTQKRLESIAYVSKQLLFPPTPNNSQSDSLETLGRSNSLPGLQSEDLEEQRDEDTHSEPDYNTLKKLGAARTVTFHQNGGNQQSAAALAKPPGKK